MLQSKKIENLTKRILRDLDCSLAATRRSPAWISHLSVVFVTDSEIKSLNRIYRGKNKPTDVLSFSLTEGEQSGYPSESLGDVVISVETAQRQAQELELTLQS